MVDELRVVRLLRAADSAVQSLRNEQTASSDRRSDPLWLPGVKYLFICAVEACIDIAQHICSTDASTAPRDNGDAMRVLGNRGTISAGDAERMRMAVGFRNVLVHEYVDVDDTIVLHRLSDLGDIDAFIGQVGEWLARTGSPDT